LLEAGDPDAGCPPFLFLRGRFRTSLSEHIAEQPVFFLELGDLFITRRSSIPQRRENQDEKVSPHLMRNKTIMISQMPIPKKPTIV
jgi:hypothetical protein